MESNVAVRLKRVAARQTVTLTHYGRKSGKPHEVTIWFVVDGDKVYIGTANVNRQWVRNVQKTPQVSLSIGGETFGGAARFLTDRAEHERAMAAIRRKYWMFRPLMALGRVLIAIGVMYDDTGSFEVTLAG
jgi:deazaflavin-dependent oxidoreductase (nitroreductase family)